MGIGSFFNDLLKGDGAYDENDEYEEYEEEEEITTASEAPTSKTAPAPATTRSTGGISSASLEMKVVKPERFDEVRTIGDHLLARRTVVLNLEDTNKETTKRIIDFLCGVVFAIDGQVKKVANATYIVTPKNVDVSGEQAEAPAEGGEAAAPARDIFR